MKYEIWITCGQGKATDIPGKSSCDTLLRLSSIRKQIETDNNQLEELKNNSENQFI